MSVARRNIMVSGDFFTLAIDAGVVLAFALPAGIALWVAMQAFGRWIASVRGRLLETRARKAPASLKSAKRASVAEPLPPISRSRRSAESGGSLYGGASDRVDAANYGLDRLSAELTRISAPAKVEASSELRWLRKKRAGQSNRRGRAA